MYIKQTARQNQWQSKYIPQLGVYNNSIFKVFFNAHVFEIRYQKKYLRQYEIEMETNIATKSLFDWLIKRSINRQKIANWSYCDDSNVWMIDTMPLANNESQFHFELIHRNDVLELEYYNLLFNQYFYTFLFGS